MDISAQNMNRIKLEVFERDAFTCQSCGAAAPDVLLTVSLLDTASDTSHYYDSAYLVTHCQKCAFNATPDNALPAHRELEELNERLAQLKMLINWKKGLQKIQDHKLTELVSHWQHLLPNDELSNDDKIMLSEQLESCSLQDIKAAMASAVEVGYGKKPPGATETGPHLKAIEKVEENCQVKAITKKESDHDKLTRLNKQLKNAIQDYYNEGRAKQWLLYALSWEVDYDKLQELPNQLKSWSQFSGLIDRMVGEQKFYLSRGRMR